MRNNKKKGFTLVELLVVIAIIAILATVSVVGYTAFIAKANQSNAETEAKQVEQAIAAELMAGNDFVIGTVDAEDADTETEGMQYADGATKTTYYVEADNNKVYTKVSTYTADDPDTDDVNEEAWSDFVDVVDANGDRIVYTGSLTAAFDANADFAALDGEFAVDANGVITYTYKDDAKATIKFN